MKEAAVATCVVHMRVMPFCKGAGSVTERGDLGSAWMTKGAPFGFPLAGGVSMPGSFDLTFSRALIV